METNHSEYGIDGKRRANELEDYCQECDKVSDTVDHLKVHLEMNHSEYESDGRIVGGERTGGILSGM